MNRREPQEPKPGLRSYSPFGGKMRFGHSGEVGGLRGADYILGAMNFGALVAAIFVASEFGWASALLFVAFVVIIEWGIIAMFRRRR